MVTEQVKDVWYLPPPTPYPRLPLPAGEASLWHRCFSMTLNAAIKITKMLQEVANALQGAR